MLYNWKKYNIVNQLHLIKKQEIAFSHGKLLSGWAQAYLYLFEYSWVH